MSDLSPKVEIREDIRALLRTLTMDEHSKFSRAMVNRLINVPEFLTAKSVLFYSPLRNEPAIHEAGNALIPSETQEYLPRFNPMSGTYEAAACLSAERMVKGPFGTLEPDAGCPSIPLNQLDFVLVPGIAFDLTGRRLGRGKGFYDRLLAEVRGHKCGVAFDAQIITEVPEEPHDVRVDSILTPTRWHLC